MNRRVRLLCLPLCLGVWLLISGGCRSAKRMTVNEKDVYHTDTTALLQQSRRRMTVRWWGDTVALPMVARQMERMTEGMPVAVLEMEYSDNSTTFATEVQASRQLQRQEERTTAPDHLARIKTGKSTRYLCLGIVSGLGLWVCLRACFGRSLGTRWGLQLGTRFGLFFRSFRKRLQHFLSTIFYSHY
ncbi:MAG: hypothetical protein Q4E10_04420 [Porphyromonas sp.]|nr:hypothetical protein [Porphyromonas sp.]